MKKIQNKLIFFIGLCIVVFGMTPLEVFGQGRAIQNSDGKSTGLVANNDVNLLDSKLGIEVGEIKMVSSPTYSATITGYFYLDRIDKTSNDKVTLDDLGLISLNISDNNSLGRTFRSTSKDPIEFIFEQENYYFKENKFQIKIDLAQLGNQHGFSGDGKGEFSICISGKLSIQSCSKPYTVSLKKITADFLPVDNSSIAFISNDQIQFKYKFKINNPNTTSKEFSVNNSQKVLGYQIYRKGESVPLSKHTLALVPGIENRIFTYNTENPITFGLPLSDFVDGLEYEIDFYILGKNPVSDKYTNIISSTRSKKFSFKIGAIPENQEVVFQNLKAEKGGLSTGNQFKLSGEIIYVKPNAGENEKVQNPFKDLIIRFFYGQQTGGSELSVDPGISGKDFSYNKPIQFARVINVPLSAYNINDEFSFAVSKLGTAMTYTFKKDNPDEGKETEGFNPGDNSGEEVQPPPDIGGNTRFTNPLKDNLDTIPKIVAAVIDGIILPITIPFFAIALIWSGFLYIKARGNPGKINEAHTAIKWTLIGGAVILGAYVIGQAVQSTVVDIISLSQKWYG